ncbi:hypothetical protein TSAR_016361 [Trichomalopsis sarcophagae]|uniref:RHD domain-containing protein n=1 Tax=Trichomalopsis sarcophagae TaxID=543379 RepID=A0A232FCM8_9HYME|nr:hypothetical protein TSAR_016361 [Trichomalopsis sarcophagae]
MMLTEHEIINTVMEGDKTSSEAQLCKPKIKIIVQPSNSRFGYKDEKRASFIKGSEGNYPAIRIHNNRGPVTVIISCVTVDPPYKPHPCKVFNGNAVDNHGVCLFYVHRPKKEIHFKKLFVETLNEEDVFESLTERERKKVDPFKSKFHIEQRFLQTGFAHKDSPKDICLDSVRLCFQVTMHSFACGSIEVDPVVSDPIYNTCSTVLFRTINHVYNSNRLGLIKTEDKYIAKSNNHNSASVAGGLKICILCEKVPSNDIEVRFFHKDIKWEALGKFVGPSIFQKVAIIIETPEFRTDTLSPENINEPIEVNIQLKRPSNGHVSDPIPFQLLPLPEPDDYQSNETDNEQSLNRKKSYLTKASSISACKALQAKALKDNGELFNDFPCEPWELPPVQPVAPVTSSTNDFPCEPCELPPVQPVAPVTSSTKTTESSKLIPNISAAKLPSEELAAVINLYVEFLRESSASDSTGTPINFGKATTKQLYIFNIFGAEPCNTIEDVMELIEKDWNSIKTISNSTDKSVLPYKSQINVSTISLAEPRNSIEGVMELIDKDWNSSRTVSNPTDKSVLPYKPQTNVSTISLAEPCNSIENVTELIDKNGNSSRTISNPTDKSVLPYKPRTNVSTITLTSNEVVNINEPNSNTKSNMQQMADSVHTEVTQPIYDLDDLILSELILDLNFDIEDIHLET